ncbi:uncharacterized protein LOC132889677 [Neoarius graeffei]|uniref:uncharacterized protein LOC132889677 n=1 Tax=Neoarius graeffei TaxID=443677 RepID=UPI00298CF4BC|nr:uncharacterized protein LOC132889677 [Neoarius graeffei]XP_060782399.1 uncharacterized protein LOC132889677 [Neoarius graeffei]XP_060782400.1 uncharacterized protein LOC132889677 [Neoarius graeffei]XP_060782401.1 uncharacterized protein LOC132889677 [Neoarius graeffei]
MCLCVFPSDRALFKEGEREQRELFPEPDAGCVCVCLCLCSECSLKSVTIKKRFTNLNSVLPSSVLRPCVRTATVVLKPRNYFGAQKQNSPMESSPFADLVHALATAQQSQHQALVALRKEQEQRFEVLVLAQQEDCQAFWHLLASVGSTNSPTAGPSPLTLTKMGPQDDPEAFLTLFEQVAETSGWPMEQRMARLLPLLTREAQLAALQPPADHQLAYTDLRRAILQRVGHTPEQQQQRFRALRLEEVSRPFAFGQQLWDACWRWLRADNRDAEGIIDQVVLKQFIAHLPARTAEWVQCHRPASLDQASELAEDYLAAVPMAGQQTASSLLSSLSLPLSSCVSSSPHSPTAEAGAGATPAGLPHPWCPPVSPFCVCLFPPPQVSEPQNTSAERKLGPVCWRCGEPGHLQQQCTIMEVGAVVRIPDAPGAALDRAGVYRISVSIQGDTYQALVDSGCNQTSIHQNLVQDEALGGAQLVKVLCVHRDVHNYPLVSVHIFFQGEKFIVKAAVNPRLTHSIILGTDWPGFGELMSQLVKSGSCRSLIRGGPGVALAGAAVTEPSMSSPCQSEEPLAPPLSIGESLVDFLLEQSRDETLRHAFDQVRVIDGQMLQPTATPSFPYFTIMKDRVY